MLLLKFWKFIFVNMQIFTYFKKLYCIGKMPYSCIEAFIGEVTLTTEFYYLAILTDQNFLTNPPIKGTTNFVISPEKVPPIL